MASRHPRPWLSAWLDGELAASRAAEVRGHVANCLTCWLAVQKLRAEHQLVCSLQHAVPRPTLWAELIRELQADPSAAIGRFDKGAGSCPSGPRPRGGKAGARRIPL